MARTERPWLPQLVRLVFIFLLAAASSRRLAFAQDAPASGFLNPDPFQLNLLKQDTERRTASWSSLTTSLEPRIAGLLPCDSRVRSFIEETSSASEARLTATSKYWRALAAKSKEQSAVLEQLVEQGQTRATEWTRDHADADQERTAVDARVVALREAALREAALQNATLKDAAPASTLQSAQEQLKAIAADAQQMAERAEKREATAMQLLAELRELLRLNQASEAAIQSQLKIVSTEAIAWNEYYAARSARAQTECGITNPGATVAPRTPSRQTTPIQKGSKQGSTKE